MIKKSGSALIYILIAIALLGALTMSFIEPSSQQSRSQNAFRLAQEITSHLETFRAAILDCVLTYPAGDTSSTAASKYTGYQHPYPLTPNATYLPVASRDAQNKASSIRCPGNPGDSNDHALIFGGSTGLFAPKTPSILGSSATYFYGNSVHGVHVYAFTASTDPFIKDAFDKIAEKYDACQVDSLANSEVGQIGQTCGTQACLYLYITRTSC